MDTIKLFFCDVETTGVDPKGNGITQIAGEVGYLSEEYKVMQTFNFNISPFPDDVIDPTALEVQKKTLNDVMGYPEPRSVFRQVHDIACGFVDRYDKKDKLFFVAYNSPFDNQFLREFWGKCGDKYFGSLFWTPDICVMRLAANHLMRQRDTLPNFKLETVAGLMGVSASGDFHDANTDIQITRDIYLKLINQREGK